MTPVDTKLWRCAVCDWIGTESELLTAPNPFDQSQTLTGCPDCRCVDGFALLCDEPGCHEEVSCGWNSPAGYRNTCGRHMRTAGAEA